MDTKHVKRSKRPRKMKASTQDGDAEVFVLPPDLLKKLGICLGPGSNSNEKLGTDVEVLGIEIENEQTNNHSKSKAKKSGDASILETASLMKKSVFLSPTFVSTAPNVIPGEMEIAHVVRQPEAPVASIVREEDISNVCFPVKNLEFSNMVIEEPLAPFDSTLDHNTTNNHTSTIDSNNGHDSRTQIHNSVHEDIINSSINSTATIESNHLGEQSLTKQSEDYLQHNQKPVTLSVPKPENDLHKINIISQEIIPLSKLKELKSLQKSNTSASTPVTINTKFGKNVNNTAKYAHNNNGLHLKETKLPIDEDLCMDGAVQQTDSVKRMKVDTTTDYYTDSPAVKPPLNINSVSNGHQNTGYYINNNPSIIRNCEETETKNIKHNINKLKKSGEDVLDNFEHKISSDSNVKNPDQNNILNTFDTDITPKLNMKFNSDKELESSKNENKVINDLRKEKVEHTTNNETLFGTAISEVSKNIPKVHPSVDNQIIITDAIDNSEVLNNNKLKLSSVKQNVDITFIQRIESIGTHDSKDVCGKNNEIYSKENPKEMCHNNFMEYSVKDADINLSNGNDTFSEDVNGSVLSAHNKILDSGVIHDNGQSYNEILGLENFENNKKKKKYNHEFEEFKSSENPVEQLILDDNASLSKLIKDNNQIHENRDLKMKLVEYNVEIIHNKQSMHDSKEENREPPNRNTETNPKKVKDKAAHKTKVSNVSIPKAKDFKNVNCNNNQNKTIKCNSHINQSKLCIQGVEKPGGENSIHNSSNKLNIVKTYQRQNMLKKSHNPTVIEPRMAECKMTDDYCDEINTAVIVANSKPQEFCLCEDFGRFDYYDHYNFYEHIHFCQHNNAVCDLDTLLNIYCDENISNPKEIENEDITEAESETLEFNICWNDIQYRDYYEGNLETELVEDKLKHGLIVDGESIPLNVNNTFLFSNLEIDHSIATSSVDICNVDLIKSKINNVDSSINKFGNNKLLNPEEENVDSMTIDEIQDTDLNNSEKDDAVSVSNKNILNPDMIKPKDHMVVYSSNDIVISSDLTANEDNFTSQSDLNIQESDLIILNNENTNMQTDLIDVVEKDNGDETVTDSESRIEIIIIDEKPDSGQDDVDCMNVLSDVDCSYGKSREEKRHGSEILVKQENLKNFLSQLRYNKSEAAVAVNGEPSDGNEEAMALKGKKKNEVASEKKSPDASPKPAKEIDKKKRKRKSRTSTPLDSIIDNDEPDRKKKIKCGVCHELLSEDRWENHVMSKHQFIAWKDGDNFNIDDEDLKKKLRQLFKLHGFLKCTFCNLEVHRFCNFKPHISTCIKMIDRTSKQVNAESTSKDSIVRCAVCQKEVKNSKWFEHIGRHHNYLAWIDGMEPLKLDDEGAVWHHLMSIIKKYGELLCYKCGISRKRAKLYQLHVETCTGDENNIPSTSGDDDQKVTVKCGVCAQEVSSLVWTEHIAKAHNYLAWQEGSTPLNLEDEDAVWEHLQYFIRTSDGLICNKCGLKRRRVTTFLSHIETCDGRENHWEESSIVEEETLTKPQKQITCGVCKEVIKSSNWIRHMGRVHDYIAWEEGSPPLNPDDEEAIRTHLFNIVRKKGELVCNKCGISRKYVKMYMDHVKECDGLPVDNSRPETTIDKFDFTFGLNDTTTQIVVCGVCKAEVEKDDWFEHIQTSHNYVAWVEGQTPIDVDDELEVNKFLNELSKVVGGFKCHKCNIVRRFAKPYLHHVKLCKSNVRVDVIRAAMKNNELVECAICHQQVDPHDWQDHAMKSHYNVAWIVGEPDIDLNSPYTVESFIKEYQNKYTNLVCKTCGITRTSRVGFYAHILLCGKTDEETKMFQAVCEICNKKYLRIYKSQHMTAHKECELAKERRRIAKEAKKDNIEDQPVEVTGRRRAAEKAKYVIEKYKNGGSEGSHRCSTCGFSCDTATELSGHVCVEINCQDATDTDESVDWDKCSDEESVDTDIDSNLSHEELEFHEKENKKKRHGDSTSTSAANKVQRIPFPIQNPRNYLKQSGKEFIEMHWTDERLFPDWHKCEYEVVDECDEAKYLPPITESCKIRSGDKNAEWSTYSRFEARRENACLSMFVGACIQCVAWAPVHVDRAAADSEHNYLAVACHLAADVPRSAWEQVVTGPGLVQIWDYGDMRVAPQLVLGIAHDYGTVWGIDWCPSGARDVLNKTDDDEIPRLGLLAIACSSGSVYIFCVPFPSTITEKDKLFYKLKPVAELRLAMGSDRKVYQATALRWSPQKGHENMVVAYSDGAMAYFDLNSESPILRTKEENVTIIYPYHDERPLNSSIEGVDIYPRGVVGGGGAWCGAVCGGGAAGCVSRVRGGAAPAAHAHVPVARAAFLPHWPSAMLAGDDAILSTSVNEVEWWGGGRRFGGARACGGCLRCGRVALAAAELLRLLRAHPAYPDLNKTIIGAIEMTPLGDKRKRKQNDDFAVVVEPTTYEDTIKKYGLEYQIITGKDKGLQHKTIAVQRQPYPERFPLSDVTSLAFCPAEQHHDQLAVAVHAGFVHVIHL